MTEKIREEGEWIFILGRWVKYCTKEIFKTLKIVLIGTTIILITVFIKYKPAYKVTLAGEAIGYITDKEKLEKKIDNYINDTTGNIAFIEAKELPSYELKLVNRGEETKEKEVLLAVEDKSIVTYKTFAITVDGTKQAEVASEEEANSIVQQVKENTKEGVNLDLGINAEYTTELKIENSEEALAALNLIKDEKTKAFEEEEKRKAEEAAKKAAEAAAKAKQFAMQSTTTLAASGALNGLSLSQPVSGVISSRFGSVSSVRSSSHTGLDIATSKGTGIRPIASGTVVYSGWKGSYGNLVIIDHGNGIESYYAHCNSLYVSVGEQVDSSKTIAAVGSTGNSTGPHLHLEIRINGTPVNPQNYLYK